MGGVLGKGIRSIACGSPGTWSRVAFIPAVPAASSLCSAGLGSLGLLGWRRKRRLLPFGRSLIGVFTQDARRMAAAFRVCYVRDRQAAPRPPTSTPLVWPPLRPRRGGHLLTSLRATIRFSPRGKWVTQAPASELRSANGFRPYSSPCHCGCRCRSRLLGNGACRSSDRTRTR